MTVERYEEAKHYADFAKWYTARLNGAAGPEFLPKVGFVSPGVAMGFLYQTDSKIVFVEGMVGNPDVSSAVRKAGLDEVSQALIAEARALGFKAMHATSDVKAIVARAASLGFAVDPSQYTCMTLFL
ncbi:MAG: hypothetical protein JNK82_11070 [Myxococcaceae bacterium]|nr:hypothetical protein [Myxococcaceae bacterium]